MFYDFFIAPFTEFLFMKRALLGSVLLVLSACPLGVFLMLRGMSLAGDAIAHAILPGVALGFLLYGINILPMVFGGLIAGMIAALGAGIIARYSTQKEDASMAVFYLVSLALGVLIISLRGSSIDLMHVLFGSVLALDTYSLIFIGFVSFITLLILFFFWRGFLAESLDPFFLRSVSSAGEYIHFLFLALAVLNLVAGFQTLGSLLSVGLMILPAAATVFWVNRISSMCFLAVFIGIFSCLSGLFLSYHLAFPSGPSIILSAGFFYFFSFLFGRYGIICSFYSPKNHRTA